MIRQSVRALEPYTPGEQPKIPNLVKLNTNENPYPPSPKVAECLRALDPAALRLYPDPNCVRIRERLADMFGCHIDNIFVGNGSDEVLRLATEAFVEDDGTVGTFTPSYSLYPVLAAIRDVECVRYPLPETGEELQTVVSDVGAQPPNLFFFANPNAPTSTVFPRSQVADFCAAYPGLLVIDEAYADFADDNCVPLALAMHNVLVCRTFSKSWSLAGIRLGYMIGPAPLIEALYKIKDSYNVNALTQAVALAALSDPDHMRATRERILATRERVTKELRRLDWEVLDSGANFLWARPPEGIAATRVKDLLRNDGIIIRHFPGPETEDFLRITIGTDEDMDALVNVIEYIK